MAFYINVFCDDVGDNDYVIYRTAKYREDKNYRYIFDFDIRNTQFSLFHLIFYNYYTKMNLNFKFVYKSFNQEFRNLLVFIYFVMLTEEALKHTLTENFKLLF